jgi:hypothetical protein
MRKLLIAALIAGQITAASTPLRAAELINADPARSPHMGTFVGGRLVVPLDGERRRETRATLTAAPMLHSTRPDGDTRMRIGQGLELGLVGAQPRVDFAGRPVSRLVRQGEAPGGRQQNISTVGWVAIGVGVLAVSVFLLYGLCGSGEICDVDE